MVTGKRTARPGTGRVSALHVPGAADPQAAVRRAARRAAMLVPPARRFIEERRLLLRQVSSLSKQVTRSEALVEQIRASYEPPDELGYLFVISYGRSGSTLLQGILNSIPGYLIRGENGDSLHRLWHYHHGLARSREKFARSYPLKQSDSWFGIDDWREDESAAELRQLVLRTLLKPLPDTRVLGFKEIRWWHKDWEQYLQFLRDVFPGARFVINTRNHEDVAKSKWWAKNANALNLLDEYEVQLDAMAAVLGDAAYRVHYDDYVADPETLGGLFEWLGEPFDRTRIDAVIGVRHSV